MYPRCLKPYNISKEKSPLVLKSVRMVSVSVTTSFAVAFIIWVGGIVCCVTCVQEVFS